MKKDPALAALNHAYRLLSIRDRSRREVEERLRQKGYDEGVILKVIEKLSEKKALSDERLAREWIKASSSLRPKGLFAIKEELARKGLDEALIDGALKDAESGYDEYKVANSLAEKRLKALGDIDRMKRKKSIYGYLARRGFSFDVINDIIDRI